MILSPSFFQYILNCLSKVIALHQNVSKLRPLHCFIGENGCYIKGILTYSSCDSDSNGTISMV